MRLAVIDETKIVRAEDPSGKIDVGYDVLLMWPIPSEGHAEIGEMLAQALYPGRFQKRKRELVITATRKYILELQEQTRRL